MEAISTCGIALAEEERDLLIQLLDRELINLPVEIHHTRTAKFRELLKHRLEVVESIFRRLNAA